MIYYIFIYTSIYLYLYPLDTHIVYHSISFSVAKNPAYQDWISVDRSRQGLAVSAWLSFTCTGPRRTWKITIFNGKTMENHDF